MVVDNFNKLNKKCVLINAVLSVLIPNVLMCEMRKWAACRWAVSVCGKICINTTWRLMRLVSPMTYTINRLRKCMPRVRGRLHVQNFEVEVIHP